MVDLAGGRFTEEQRGRLEGLYAELRWRACLANESYFLENHWSIATPNDGRSLFKLRDAQRFALSHWRNNRYSLTLKARQIGWSTLVTAHCGYSALTGEAREIILLSRNEREAEKLLAKVKYGYRNLPDWLKERAPKLLDNNRQRMTFDNGSVILSMPSESDPARGSSAWLIVVDEWAFLPNAEEAWSAIEPVADIGGRIIGLSTANGSGNFFHELWVNAETGHNFFETMFFPWSAVPERDDAWYESKRRSMSDWSLSQEYPSNPEEAFIRSGRPYMDLDAVQRQAVNARPPREGVLLVA